MPALSFLIPAFNAASTLESTLRSALAQNITDSEFLIIDDGSTDGTRALAEKLAAQDSRIRVLSQPNAGAAAGLNHARGTFIQFLDADDLLCDNASHTLLEAEAKLSCGAAAGTFEVFSPTDGSLLLLEPPGESLGLAEVLVRNYVSSISQIIRRDLIGDLRFNTSYACYEDQDLWIRLAERGVRWAVTPRIVARYRASPGSLSKSAHILPCAEDVYLRAAARTGALSAEQLHTRLSDFTLGYSTRMAIAADSPEAGAKLFAGARVKPHITANRAAAMGHSQSIFALGRWPRPDLRVSSTHTLNAALTKWWSSCIDNRWMNAEDLPIAQREFAYLCVSPQRIVETLLSQCDGDGCGDITLIGFGRNAQAFLKHNHSSRRIFIRDDRPLPLTTTLPPNVHTEPMNAPLPAGRAVVVTPLDDDALARAFPNALRWKTIRNQLADHSRAA